MRAKNKQIIIKNIDNFIISLNNESNNNSIVIVEGKKDIEALCFLGYKGKIKAYHHYRGITNFIDRCANKYSKLILLLDSDRNGEAITKKILSHLNGRNIDLSYKKRLQEITNWNIKKIEEIKSFYISTSENKSNKISRTFIHFSF